MIHSTTTSTPKLLVRENYLCATQSWCVWLVGVDRRRRTASSDEWPEGWGRTGRFLSHRGSSLDHLGRLGIRWSSGFFSAMGVVAVEGNGFTVLFVRSVHEGWWQEVVIRLEGMGSKWE